MMNIRRPIDELAKTWRVPEVFLAALLLSLILHGLLLGITFTFPRVTANNLFSPPLELVLVNSKSAKAPRHADALAQSNLDGGGNTDADRHAKSPLPVQLRAQREMQIEAAQRQVKALEEENRKIMAQLKSTYALAETPPQLKPADETRTANTGANRQVARTLEMAKLEAQISRDYEAYQKRPHKAFIGARTREYIFARYIEDWRIKVERIGNQNYPDAAKQQKIYGTLQLTVSIKADGSLEDVEVVHHSGSKILDNAAVSIVREAAPYSPFPPDMRKKIGVISITRTWTFAPGDQLSTKE